VTSVEPTRVTRCTDRVSSVRCALCIPFVFAVAVVPSASAKDFAPGDLWLCGANRCAPITNRYVLDKLSAFYYGARKPARVPQPRLGAPYLELRFDNGYVTGIAARANLDRFLSYGVYLGRFRRGNWYALPPPAAHELRWLAGTSITPFSLSRAALARSR
jgi:hypothetical protein